MRFFLATAALLLAGAVQAAPFPQPAQSGTTSKTPHYLQKTITLQPGKTSGAIKIPARNVPVHMMVAVPTFGDRGVGEATIMSVGPNDAFLAWVGFDVSSNHFGSAASIVSNDSPAPTGTHIVYADGVKDIDVQQDGADSIRIKSIQSKPMTVVVTLTW